MDNLKTRGSTGQMAALVFLIGLFMPWMVLPWAYGAVTHRWAWFHRWLDASLER